MKKIKSVHYASSLVAALLLVTPFSGAEEHSPPAIVTRYCSGCHALDGRSQLPYIPRLAGLRAEYMQHKVADFKAAGSVPVDEAFLRASSDGLTREGNAHMVGTAHALSAQDVEAATQWYAAQRPAPAKSGNRQAIEQGRDLYLNGLQSQRVPACQNCHGPAAQGGTAAPRLAGQNATYVLSQLALFRTNKNEKSPMTAVARSLESQQARALAAYLQSR